MPTSQPAKRHTNLSVAIPASLVSDVPHLREKTLKTGFVGRALAIFRVDEAVIFPDALNRNQDTEAELVATILSYMETPQYLRKRLFKIRPELRYAGVLPPLRTPHHPLKNRKKDLKIGEYREGVVVFTNGNGAHVDIGVEHPILVPNAEVSPGTRVTVRITEKGRHAKAQLADSADIAIYWGYKVTVSKLSLGHMLERGSYDLVVATSRHGEPLMNVADTLAKHWKRSKRVLVAFGAASQGLQEILSQEDLNLEEVSDFIINTVPNQGTKTVRTEEALYATLAALNLFVDERTSTENP